MMSVNCWSASNDPSVAPTTIMELAWESPWMFVHFPRETTLVLKRLRIQDVLKIWFVWMPSVKCTVIAAENSTVTSVSMQPETIQTPASPGRQITSAMLRHLWAAALTRIVKNWCVKSTPNVAILLYELENGPRPVWTLLRMFVQRK